MTTWKNQLFFGDNLDILRRHIPVGSVDLIYLDPPFNSNATYNVLFSEKTAEKSAAQITAFEDTWHWGDEAEGAYHEVVTAGPRQLADLLQALRSFLGQNDMMAYLTMMAIRLVEMHRVLKPTGSDRGIDGVIVFGEGQGKYQKVLVSVKSGHVNVAMVRDLKGVLEREQAALGALLTLKPPTRPMREEAAAAGFYVPENFPEHRFPRLQILTVTDLFAGKKLEYPRWWSEETFKKAARQRKGPNDADRQRDLIPDGGE